MKEKVEDPTDASKRLEGGGTMITAAYGEDQAVEADFTPIVDVRVDEEREEMRKTRRARVTG